MSEEADYGSTAGLHESIMLIFWGPVVDVAIFLALYTYRKWWAYIHGIIGLMISILSLASSLPILVSAGMVGKSNEYYTHFIIGLVCMILIGLQAILGVTLRVVNICQGSSNTILTIRRIHQILGYTMTTLCKVNIMVIEFGDYVVFLVIDVIFAVMIIVWKVIFPRMEKTISPKMGSPSTLITSIR